MPPAQTIEVARSGEIVYLKVDTELKIHLRGQVVGHLQHLPVDKAKKIGKNKRWQAVSKLTGRMFGGTTVADAAAALFYGES